MPRSRRTGSTRRSARNGFTATPASFTVATAGWIWAHLLRAASRRRPLAEQPGNSMTAEPHLADLSRNATAPSEAVLHFLHLSARLLLEYNVRSKSIERRIDRMAQYL